MVNGAEQPIQTVVVELARGKVRVREYRDGTIRLTIINSGHLAMTECYIAGSPIALTFTEVRQR